MELAGIGILGVFGAGIVSFLSPCVLPLVPGYLSYVAGQTAPGSSVCTRSRVSALGLSTSFVLGFTTVFAMLGASATALGQLLLQWRYEMNIVGGIMVVAFGLFTMGVPRPISLMRDLRFQANVAGGAPMSAYLLGMAFAFGWTPCIGPILGAILTVSAGSATVAQGLALLTIYSLGLGVPFLVAAFFVEAFGSRMKRLRVIGRRLQFVAGMVMVAMGIAMVTGYLSSFAYWLLEAFPALGRIG